ncbi:hypothetical protein AS156_25775 [Bradyrhizobium macuxiense]|uniref:Helix-turn-helix domain-containing protein n=1 Tax=Bradyrhizobium macuxiense TaxID=1755647 RepID=A0A120FS52_9BRAD|nr:hypothetical protein AS156_25775 [Bradyrhizobium macuxiense]
MKPSSSFDTNRLGWRPVEWARLLGVSPSAIYLQIAQGKLPVIKVGATKIVPRSVAVEAGLIDD